MHESSESTPARTHPSVGCAALLKALADDTRLTMVRTLLGGARSVTELCDMLHLGQSLASRHLGILRGLGLVTAHRQAQRVIYEIAPDVRGKVRATSPRLDLGCCEVRFR